MTNSVRVDSEVQENSTIPDPISVLTDYAMCVAHERELRVTGHPHDEDLALQNFQAAVMRSFRTKVRYKTRTTFPNSLAQTSLAAFCRGMKDHVNSEDMCNAMMWFLGIEEIEPEEVAQETKKRSFRPLSDFREDQWWVQELNKIWVAGTSTIEVTDDLKRAVAVVHHLLKSVRESESLDVDTPTPVAVVESGYSGDPDTRGTLIVKALDLSQCKVGDSLYVKSFGSEVKSPSVDVLENALQVFENRERGIPQARIAASLVAELRSTLSEAKRDQKVAVEQCLEAGKTFRALRRVVTLLLEARHTLSPEDHELRDRIDQLLQNGTD